MEILAAVGMICATIGLFAVWAWQAREPAGLSWVYRSETWTRAMGWTAVLVIGLFVVSSSAVVVAVFALVVEAALWSLAKTFGP
jgi:hypothetical protein